MTDSNASPKISVVMATHNDVQNLGETLDSILGQKGVDFEFIVVNDGSTDNTADVLAYLSALDSRLVIINQENQGLTRSLITGCAAARGIYIARQDAGGDQSLPNRLSKQAAALDRYPEVAYVSCWSDFREPGGALLFTDHGKGVALQPTKVLDLSQEWCAIDVPSCHPSVMFRKSSYQAAGGYRDAFYYGQDQDLWYRMAEQGSFLMLPETLYHVVVSPGGISMHAKAKQMKIALLSREACRLRARGEDEGPLLEHARNIRPSGATRKTARSRAEGYCFIADCLKSRQDPLARSYYRKACKAAPFYWRSWLGLLRA